MSAVADSSPAPAVDASGAFAELTRDKPALLAAAYLAVLVFAAVFAPLIAPYDPAAQSLRFRLNPPVWLAGGSWAHVLGTDHLGRDVLSRIIHGARASLLVSLAVAFIAGSFGVTMGLLAGYAGRRVDRTIMRFVDIQLSFPDLLLALTVLTVLGAAPTTIVVILAISGWTVYARMTRGIVAATKQEGYVEAALIAGCRPGRIIIRHILPNLTAPLLTLAIIEFARVALAEAALSFLGMGIQPPATSWGLDIATGKDHVFGAWWLVTFPGMAIALTATLYGAVLSNLVALPISDKLSNRANELATNCSLVIDAVLMIRESASPAMVFEQLLAYLPLHHRGEAQLAKAA